MDAAIAELTRAGLGDGRGISVAAVGGYGRGELSPHSDIDLLFVVSPKADVTGATLRGLLYPLWDAGFQVGHGVRNPKEAIDQAQRDLDAATSLLTARLLAGDSDPFQELIDRRSRWMRKEARSLVRRILDTRAERHKRVDRAGWSLAPDIKDDVGGLRDLHAVRWMAEVVGAELAHPDLLAANELLLAVREALHAEVSRKTDRMHIDLQPRVAARLGLDGPSGADDLMWEVHTAARTVEHEGTIAIETLAARVLGGPKRSGSVQTLDHHVRAEEGQLVLDPTARSDPRSAMRLLAAVARTGRRAAPQSVDRLREAFAAATGDDWDDELRAVFLQLLRGPFVASALELIDHVGGWVALLPEWAGVRGRAQHDPYHRYTVDAHSFVAVGEVTAAIASDQIARAAAEEAGDLDALYIGTLLHDVGKGSGQDHSLAGEQLAHAICTRMGVSAETTDEVCFLVRRHLLLVDTATRRDIDDGAVIENLAGLIPNPRLLRLLYILSVADALATGPEGWTEWKAALVRELYRKVLIAIETGQVPVRSDVASRAREIEAFEPSLAGRAEELLATLPHSYLESASIPDMADELRLLARPPSLGEVRVHVFEADDEGHAAITICIPDRPGTLARAAGVLALNRISVLRAQAYSTNKGLALERFVVKLPPEARWDRVEADLAAVFSGRLALEARLERKILDYRPESLGELEVRVLQDAAEHSTIIEVRAHDALGLLFAIAAALTDLDLDIHVAKIDTLGVRVVDVFYVRTVWGTKLGDDQADEVERSIRHRIARLFG